MQIIHLSKVNKTDQDLYFFVDRDQSVDRDFIRERERERRREREGEREMIKRERDRRSRKIRGYKDVNPNSQFPTTTLQKVKHNVASGEVIFFLFRIEKFKTTIWF